MATFKICIFEHQKRMDGKYPVSIRITWKRKIAYLKTEYYASDRQIFRKTIKLEGGKIKHIFELRDKDILNELNRRISIYEDLKAKKLGLKIELYSARELVDYFRKETAPGSENIDFVEFSTRYIENLISLGRKSTAKTLKTPLNAMVDFCAGRSKIGITEVTTKFLHSFESYLRKDRILKRTNQLGKVVETKEKGVSDVTVHDYMTAIRILFNAAMDEYNDEDRDEIRIKHYPFRKYKFTDVAEPEKRNISPGDIRKIFTITDETLKYKRNILARDVFMLSFYLAGTNLADLFNAKAPCYKSRRFSFERQKTRGRRKDNAYISIKVMPEAKLLFDKYKDPAKVRVFNFYHLYADSGTFLANIDKGLKKVAVSCGISRPLSSYYARFSFASIARNDCNLPKDDINLALNHVDSGMKITDVYIEKDWSIVDRTIRAVIDHLLNIPPEPTSSQSAEIL